MSLKSNLMYLGILIFPTTVLKNLSKLWSLLKRILNFLLNEGMVHLPAGIVRKILSIATIRRQQTSKLIFVPLCLKFRHEVCKYVGNYMNSPELATGISVKIFLLTISKLPPTSIVPKSMSRARLRKSRLGLADITSKDGTLSSFRFESFLQYNKNIIDTRNVEYPKFSLYYFYKIYTSVVSCVCGLYVRWKP